MTPAESREAAREAAKFGVCPDIHAEDYIYLYHLPLQADADRAAARARVVEYYFFDGNRSAANLDDLVRQYHPHADKRRLHLLEFASNFGCVSRHLHKMQDRYDLLACDFHGASVTFLRDRLGIPALLADIEPGETVFAQKFDIVFAMYFFSHTGHRTFGAWITKLCDALAEDGMLVFVTHGRVPYEILGCPVLQPDGYWFTADSDRRHLPTEEYGHMVATPGYVMQCIACCPNVTLVAFKEAFWWGQQDVYVVRKLRHEFRPLPAVVAQQANPQALRDAIDAIHRSTSWRVTEPLRRASRLLTRRLKQ